MLAMQYSHRLPSDYDMQTIRSRAARRGPLWDHTDGLIFKAFVSQDRGQHGATGNLYASVYLWRNGTAAAEFLMGDRFQSVIDAFGRPRVETWLPLHFQKGPAREALSLYREESSLDAGVDRETLQATEAERNQTIASQADTVAVWTVLDVHAWRLLHFTLSSAPPYAARAPLVYEVLYLAHPGL